MVACVCSRILPSVEADSGDGAEEEEEEEEKKASRRGDDDGRIGIEDTGVVVEGVVRRQPDRAARAVRRRIFMRTDQTN